MLVLWNGTAFMRLRGGEQKCAKKYGVLLRGERLDGICTRIKFPFFNNSPYTDIGGTTVMLTHSTHLLLL